MRPVASIVALALCMESVNAGITITSRTSSAEEYGHGEHICGFNCGNFDYDNVEAYAAAGHWSVTLPESGFFHEDTVQADLISGGFDSSYSFAVLAAIVKRWTTSSLDTHFTVSNVNAVAIITVVGGGTPLAGNVQLFDSNDQLLFDADSLAVLDNLMTQSYHFDGESHVISLPPGDYRLSASALPQGSPIVGGHSTGSTSFTATVRLDSGCDGCCIGDLNADTLVDDSDFVVFVRAYDLLFCGEAAMPLGCPADLNNDAYVDDSDFVLFVGAYNALLCP